MPTYIIEAAHEKNRNPLFHPLQIKLRGRWSHHNMRGRASHESIQALPETLPGIHLSVDTDRKVLRMWDPLADPENKVTTERIEAAQKQYPNQIPKGKPWPEKVIENATDDQLKTWLYWMRRMVDAGMAIVARNSEELPSLERIQKIPARTQIGQFNSLSQYPQFKEQYDDYGMPLSPEKSRAVLENNLSAARQTAGAGAPQ